MKSTGIHVLQIGLVMCLAGCGGGNTKQVDQSSPRAVLKSFGTAMSERDWESAFGCMDEDSQNFVLSMPIMQARFMAMSDESRKSSLDELLERHGYEEQPPGGGEEAMRKSFANVDKPALFEDLLVWHDENRLSTEGGEGPAGGITRMKPFTVDNIGKGLGNEEKMPDLDIQIDGETATAKMTPDHGTEVTLHFEKIDDKWYYDFATTMKESINRMNENRASPPGKHP